MNDRVKNRVINLLLDDYLDHRKSHIETDILVLGNVTEDMVERFYKSLCEVLDRY